MSLVLSGRSSGGNPEALNKTVTTPSRDDVLRFREGATIKSYRLVNNPASIMNPARLAPLGEGGCGVVYLASQSLHHEVEVRRAIKFFMYRDDIARLSTRGSPISKDDFLAEIVNISSINHEHLVKVVDAGMYAVENFEVPYIVTEYVEGPTLREVLEQKNVSGVVSAWHEDDGAPLLHLLIEIAQAIEYLHSTGYSHCDIAPKNIFLKASENHRAIVGDLGLAKKVTRPRDAVFMAGTRSYMPPEALALFNEVVPWAEFVKIHPRWDVWAYAKTGLEVLSSFNGHRPPRWRKALQSALDDAQAGKRYTTMAAILERLQFLQPVHRQFAAVPELSATITDKVRKLMPIHSLTTSGRFRRIMQHPGVMRLARVPQLSTTLFTFPAATHTRYEHSLGVMETVRRYLVALLDQEDFLEHLSPRKIEVALLSALLSNVTRFPMSNLLHEVKQQNESMLSVFGRESLLQDIFALQDNKGRTLRDLVRDDFPGVSLEEVFRILLGRRHEFGSDDQLIHSLLNCSLDARVIDFVRRDSLHLGIHEGYAVDLDGLLPHFRVLNHRLALQVTGVTVAEQIIALRYWLFSRIYWCRPNRAFVAMVRYLMMELFSDCDALHRVRGRVLRVDQREFLFLLLEEAKISARPELIDLARLLTQDQQDFYRVVFDESPAEAPGLRPVWKTIDQMTHMELKQLGQTLARAVLPLQQVVADRIPILIDLPQEPGSTKLGDDIMVVGRDKTAVGLTDISGIVRGVNESFNQHLRRLRIFVHPALTPSTPERKARLEAAIADYLVSNFV